MRSGGISVGFRLARQHVGLVCSCSRGLFVWPVRPYVSCFSRTCLTLSTFLVAAQLRCSACSAAR